MKTLFVWSLTLCLTIVLLAAAPARAQTALVLDSLEINLWSEFDKPEMLVILNGTLASDVPLPAEVTLHIPAAAGGPHAVASQNESGQLVDAPNTVAAEGQSLAVRLQVPYRIFRVEYYDPGLTITGQQRAFKFELPMDYAARRATLSAQEPIHASAFSFQPALALSSAGLYGLNYYATDLGALSAGQIVSLTLNYIKPDTTLTASVVDEPAPLTTNGQPGTPSAGLLSPWLEIGLISGVGLILAGGAGWYWFSTHPRGETARPPRRRHTNHPAVSAEAKERSAAGFCTQCGGPRMAGDRFCRKCGATVRV